MAIRKIKIDPDPLGKMTAIKEEHDRARAARSYKEAQTLKNTQRASEGYFNLPYISWYSVSRTLFLVAITCIALLIVYWGISSYYSSAPTTSQEAVVSLAPIEATPTPTLEMFVILPVKLNGQLQTGWNWMEVTDPFLGYQQIAAQTCGISNPSFEIPENAKNAFIWLEGRYATTHDGKKNPSSFEGNQISFGKPCWPMGLKFSLWVSE